MFSRTSVLLTNFNIHISTTNNLARHFSHATGHESTPQNESLLSLLHVSLHIDQRICRIANVSMEARGSSLTWAHHDGSTMSK